MYSTAICHRKLNQAGYDCVFLESPHLLTMTSTDKRENAKAWFLLNAQDPSDASLSQSGIPLTYIGLEESLQMVQEELQRNDVADESFTAILGFSQGAVFCHILSVLAQREPYRFGAIKAALLASGFAAQHVPDPSAYYDTGRLSDRDIVTEIPSLHLIGKNDTSVNPALSLDLVELFRQGQIMWHEKGHIVPQKSAECADMIAFLEACRTKQQSSSLSSSSSRGVQKSS